MVNSCYGAGATWRCDGGKTVRRETLPSEPTAQSGVSLGDGAATHVEVGKTKRLYKLKTRPPMPINDPSLPKQISHETVFITSATIIGEDNYVKGDHNKVYGNHNKVAGDGAVVYGNYCVVRGTSAKVYGNNCSVIGENVTCTGRRCQVIGRGSTWHNKEPFLDDIIPPEILASLPPSFISDCPPETNKSVLPLKMRKMDEEVVTVPPPPPVATLPVPPTPQIESSATVKK